MASSPMSAPTKKNVAEAQPSLCILRYYLHLAFLDDALVPPYLVRRH